MAGHIVIGIDPGVSGGIAWIDCDKPREFGTECRRMPDTEHGVAVLLAGIVEDSCESITAYIERVHSSPQMGVSSAFTFGRGYGLLLGLLLAHRVRINDITPGTWQKAMGLVQRGKGNTIAGADRAEHTKAKKLANKEKAGNLFPWIKVTNYVADALLIAEYGVRLSDPTGLDRPW